MIKQFMIVKVNNEIQEYPLNSTVGAIMEKNNIRDTRGIAIAINENIVKKDNWQNVLLRENDEIIIIKATQGG